MAKTPKRYMLKFRIIYLKIDGTRNVAIVEAPSVPSAIEKIKKEVNAEMDVWYTLVDVKRMEDD